MVQNQQIKYFWNQEGQEALYFQFQLNQTTFKFWPYVAFSKILALRGNLNSRDIFILKPLLELPNPTTTLPRPALCYLKICKIGATLIRHINTTLRLFGHQC